MLKLIKNEYAKIFLKKSTYIILGVCLLLSMGISLLIQYAYNQIDEYYYYEELSIEEDMSHYKNSEYVYDQIYYMECQMFIEMGYEYFSDVPSWVWDGVSNALYNHYAYVVASQMENRESAEMELGISLEGIDVEYEKKVSEEMLNAIKAGDYLAYNKSCLAYFDYQKENDLPFDQVQYEVYKYIVEHGISPEADEKKMFAVNMYASAKANYDTLIKQRESGENVTEYQLEKEKKIFTIYQYILDNDIDNYLTETLDYGDMYEGKTESNTNKFITAITSNTMIGGMAGIFVMIIAAGIIANEFSNGTIKFLLINPVKRTKIFWSKYITCLSLLVSSLAVFFVVYFLFCMLTCGTDGLDGVYLSYVDGVAHEESIILYALKQYTLSGVSLLTSITLAFTISSLMRSNAVAIAISIVIEFLGATITMFLYEFGHDWARYLVFANTDLASISKGVTLFPGQTLGFALVVIAIYMVIFLLTAYDGFKKKEV